MAIRTADETRHTSLRRHTETIKTTTFSQSLGGERPPLGLVFDVHRLSPRSIYKRPDQRGMSVDRRSVTWPRPGFPAKIMIVMIRSDWREYEKL